jgi:hypothetical protein
MLRNINVIEPQGFYQQHLWIDAEQPRSSRDNQNVWKRRRLADMDCARSASHPCLARNFLADLAFRVTPIADQCSLKTLSGSPAELSPEIDHDLN